MSIDTYEILTRYFHFLGIMLLSSILIFQHLILKYNLQKEIMKKLTFTNYMLLTGFIVVFISGVILWIYLGKPYDFYSKNWIFHLKGSLVALLFTLFIINSTKLKTLIGVKNITKILNIQLTLLLFIILSAVLMAKGIGYYGFK